MRILFRLGEPIVYVEPWARYAKGKDVHGQPTGPSLDLYDAASASDELPLGSHVRSYMAAAVLSWAEGLCEGRYEIDNHIDPQTGCPIIIDAQTGQAIVNLIRQVFEEQS